MRVGLYIPVFDDRPAGVGVYIEEVCSRLVALNPDVVVFTGSADVRRPWVDPRRVRTFGRPLFGGLRAATGLRRRARRLLWLSTFAGRTLQAECVDVLFSPVQEGPLSGHVPSVVVMHDLTALRYPEAYDRLTVAQTRWLLPRMLRRASRVIAVSGNTRDDVLTTYSLDAARVTVVGEGFDRRVFYPRGEVEIAAVRRRFELVAPYLLYAGTASRHKNLGLVLRALARLGPEAKSVPLVLVGRQDAGQLDELLAEADQLGLRDRLRLVGYVSRDELALLMSGAAAFVYPSRYEGFGLAPLEAMATGARVIASNVASLPEVVGPGGTLVETADPAAWAEAISIALRSSPGETRAAAIRQASRFDWDDVASRVLGLLKAAAR